MSELISQPDFEELEALLLDSVNANFAESDRKRLNTLLRDSAEARAFASELLFDDALLTDSLSTEAAEAVFREEKTHKITAKHRNNSKWFLTAAAIAIGLIALTFLVTPSGSPATTVAIVQSTNRISGLSHGQTLKAGERIELQQGRAVLRFASGAKFAVEAPASLAVTGPNDAKLDAGRGTLRVPGKIKGFTLVTPSERVVDLGTAFGIDVTDDGATSVAVFEGEVELHGTGHPHRLYAGQSTQSIAPESPAQSIPHLVDAFLNTWETSFGVESVVGDLRVARPGERLAPLLAVDSKTLLLFPEREGVTLPEGFTLNSTQTGLHERPFGKQVEHLSESLTVDSYLLQYNPGVDSSELGKEIVFTAELQFDRPVVGLILGVEQLKASDAKLAMPGAQLKSITRRGINFDDQVELSEDRRTLHIRMSIQDSLDQIRVLVDANA
ncbi:MAG: FecR domain-containing protein [Verrucomicrobiales bacterium]|nr:FecR domain-containing protein [Verrucomicrobiales bacterium]